MPALFAVLNTCVPFSNITFRVYRIYRNCSSPPPECTTSNSTSMAEEQRGLAYNLTEPTPSMNMSILRRTISCNPEGRVPFIQQQNIPSQLPHRVRQSREWRWGRGCHRPLTCIINSSSLELNQRNKRHQPTREEASTTMLQC